LKLPARLKAQRFSLPSAAAAGFGAGRRFLFRSARTPDPLLAAWFGGFLRPEMQVFLKGMGACVGNPLRVLMLLNFHIRLHGEDAAHRL